MQIQFKLLTSLILLFISGTVFAQSLSIVGGGNYTTVEVTSARSDTYSSKIGFHAGAYLDYVLKKDKSNELVIETGLLFDAKGAVQELSGVNIEYNTSLYYADIPLYLKYRYRFRSLNKVYVGVGPYVGMGLFGTIKGTGEDYSEKETVRWGSSTGDDHFKRLDYGLSARVGFLSVGGLDFAVSYDYGLPNISSLNDNDEMKSRMIRLSVGYHFSLVD